MSQDQRCFNHDYRAPFFYLFTMVTAPRRPLFGTCSDNRTHLSEEGAISASPSALLKPK